MSNGNIIGLDNTPTIAGASGLWEFETLYEARLADKWPFVSAGYIFVGAVAPGALFDQVWRISESTDTALLTYQQTVANIAGRQGGVFGSTIKGYFLFHPGLRLNTYSFGSDSYSFGPEGSGWPPPSPGASTVRTEGGSFQSSTFGYACNGANQSSNPFYATASKWSFATEARTEIGVVPSGSVRSAAGTDTLTDGYVAGGSGAGGYTTDTIRKLPFSTETWSTIVTTLTSARGTGSARTATQSTAAYWLKNDTDLDKFTFSTEAISVVVTASRASPFGGIFRYSSPTRASWASSASGTTITVSFFDFATEDMSSTTIPLTTAGLFSANIQGGGLFPQA